MRCEDRVSARAMSWRRESDPRLGRRLGSSVKEKCRSLEMILVLLSQTLGVRGSFLRPQRRNLLRGIVLVVASKSQEYGARYR